MQSIYVTGGGKCGTHLVAAFMHANWQGSHLHPTEFKNWQNGLPNTKRFIFNCPVPDIPRYRELCDDGNAIVLLRNPVQQMMSWLCSGAGGYVRAEKLGHWQMDLHGFAMERTLCGFEAAPDADAVWRIEDFSASRDHRFAMASKVLNDDFAGVDPSITVPQSRFGLGNGVKPINGSEYPAMLTQREIETFSRPDIDHAYPGWRENLVMRDESDITILKHRFRYICQSAADRYVRLAREKGKPPPSMLDPTEIADGLAEAYHSAEFFPQ